MNTKNAVEMIHNCSCNPDSDVNQFRVNIHKGENKIMRNLARSDITCVTVIVRNPPSSSLWHFAFITSDSEKWWETLGERGSVLLFSICASSNLHEVKATFRVYDVTEISFSILTSFFSALTSHFPASEQEYCNCFIHGSCNTELCGIEVHVNNLTQIRLEVEHGQSLVSPWI